MNNEGKNDFAVISQDNEVLKAFAKQADELGWINQFLKDEDFDEEVNNYKGLFFCVEMSESEKLYGKEACDTLLQFHYWASNVNAYNCKVIFNLDKDNNALEYLKEIKLC